MSLIWGSVLSTDGAVAPYSEKPLAAMSSLARSEGEIYRGHSVILAQFPRAPATSLAYAPTSFSEPYTVVADSRLDNRAELCHTFGWSGVDLISDERLILEAYRRWGNSCPKHLLGDFAFAIWNSREKHLFCARDHLGITPFYYWYNGADFCFASDLEGILAYGQVVPELNLRYVKTCLLYDSDYYHPRYSFFESVYKLPAGHTLTLQDKGLTLTSYWRPTDVPSASPSHDGDYFEQLRQLLYEAVGCRLIANQPVAAHLSSGLDSSTVAVLAARLSPKPLTTFSWSQPGNLSALKLPYDERSEIEELRDIEGVDVYYTELAESDILDAFNDLTRTPQVHQATESAVLVKAQTLGVHSLLSGWGGDEGVSYYGRAYLSGLLRQGRLKELVEQLYGWSRRDGPGVWYRGLMRAVGLNLPEPLRRSYNRFWAAPDSLPKCLNPKFRAALDGVESYPWHGYVMGRNVKTDQAALLTRGPITQRTEAWAAQAIRYGMSYTYPLLDKRVVEFALSVPDHLYFQNGQNRYLFRQATKGILPDSVRLKTLKRDPALEEHYYALLDAIMHKGLLLEKLTQRRGALEMSGVLDVQAMLESVRACGSFYAYLNHPSGVNKALWLAFLHPETSWRGR